jgi:lipoyl(octanoyl) transferase
MIIRNLGICDYSTIWQQMKSFTMERTDTNQDEIWELEHFPVFTQGQAGDPKHILKPGNIPVVTSDRGGQVTYHGPGQLVLYFLINLNRQKLGIRAFIDLLEGAVIDLLANYNIQGKLNSKAPGVYVDQAKICSLGLRVRKGFTYHGLSLNIAMDLTPFSRINTCGFPDLKVVQTSDLGGPNSISEVSAKLLSILTERLKGQTS